MTDQLEKLRSLPMPNVATFGPHQDGRAWSKEVVRLLAVLFSALESRPVDAASENPFNQENLDATWERAKVLATEMGDDMDQLVSKAAANLTALGCELRLPRADEPMETAKEVGFTIGCKSNADEILERLRVADPPAVDGDALEFVKLVTDEHGDLDMLDCRDALVVADGLARLLVAAVGTGDHSNPASISRDLRRIAVLLRSERARNAAELERERAKVRGLDAFRGEVASLLRATMDTDDAPEPELLRRIKFQRDDYYTACNEMAKAREQARDAESFRDIHRIIGMERADEATGVFQKLYLRTKELEEKQVRHDKLKESVRLLGADNDRLTIRDIELTAAAVADLDLTRR